MKKIAALFMSALLAFGLMACGNTQGDSSIQQNENAQAVSQADETTSSVDTSVPEKEDMETEGKILVVYFSVPETDSPNNMNIEEVKTIKELKPYLKDYNLVAYEETAKQHQHGELFHTLQQIQTGNSLMIIVGCEGGFDESEIKELNEMGVKCCSLGNRILRSETAPLYLMSVIGYTRELVK